MNTNKKVVDAPTLTTKTGLIMLIHYKLPRHWIYSLTAALMMTAIDFPSAAAAPIVQSKNSYLSSRRFPVTNQSNQLKLKRVMLRDPLVQPATYPQKTTRLGPSFERWRRTRRASVFKEWQPTANKCQEG